MKKISSFILLATIATVTAQAQQLTPKKLVWGIKTGINFSNVRVEDGLDSDWKTGLAVGAFFIFTCHDKFSIQPEFLYSSMGGRELAGNGGSSLRLNYFSIPVLARFQVKNKLAIVAGPQIDILIQAKTKSISNQFDKVTDNYREYSFNGTAGFEFWPTHCFGMSARYIYGFTNLTPKSLNTTGGNILPNIKNQGVQITAALKL